MWVGGALGPDQQTPEARLRPPPPDHDDDDDDDGDDYDDDHDDDDDDEDGLYQASKTLMITQENEVSLRFQIPFSNKIQYGQAVQR